MGGEPIEGRCNARTRRGTYCKNYPTRSNGRRCHFHGGAPGSGRPIVTGRYSKVLRSSLRQKYEDHLADDNYRELRCEIAIERALFSEYLSRFPDGIVLSAEDLGRLFDWSDKIGRMIERVARIENQTALTAREVQFLEVTIVNLLGQYVPDDKREDFAAQLARALGSESIASLPSSQPTTSDISKSVTTKEVRQRSMP